MAIYTVELDGKEYDIEGDREPTEQDVRDLIGSQQQQTPEKRQTPSLTGLPQDITDNPRIQPQNILGELLNVPGAANRSLFQGKGYTAGALNPDQVPTFSSMEQSQPQAEQLKQLLYRGGIPSMGTIADFATNPAEVLSAIPVGKVISGAAKILKPLLKWENVAQQAEKSKGALEALKKSYGSVYRVALDEVKDVPTTVDFGKMPVKVFNKIKEVKDTYGVEFNQNGSIKNTVANVSRVKEAANDMISPSQMKEFTNKEVAQIGEFAKHISDEMKVAAKGVGKPIDEAMKLYAEFRDNYDLINDRLLDKRGTAMSNMLKEQTRLTTDRTVKNAWKVLAKESPDIKEVMNSRKNREILKGLLKVTPVGAAGAGAIAAGVQAVR